MIPIKSFMTTDVVTVKPDVPIYEALHLLSEREISGMPVVDDNNQVVGILSEKDVLRILIDDKLDVTSKVSDYMSHGVVCFTETDNAFEICKFFINSHYRRVPIVKDGKLVGIVSRRDIVGLILEVKSKISDFRYD